MWYDIEKLLSDTDAREVVRTLYARDDYKQAGSTLFVRCPGGHRETRLDHCAVYKSGCKCFSCGNSYSTVDMLMRYFPNDTFPEICDRLADCTGNGRQMYGTGKKAKKKTTIPWSKEDLRIIGIVAKEGELSLSTFYTQDEKACRKLVTEQARYYLNKYSSLLRDETNPFLKEEWKKRYTRVKMLLQDMGEESSVVPKLFRL